MEDSNQIPHCSRCEKDTKLCICDSIVPLETKTKVLILQHPQEPDKKLGTARIAQLSLSHSQLKVGLSWPNLAKASGDKQPFPKDWVVLHLGSGVKGRQPHKVQVEGARKPQLIYVNKKGEYQPQAPEVIEGLIILDGTWSQAKTLWWRNAWLLKCQRAVLIPSAPSLYGKLRKEPRRECLSTIESIGQALTAIGEDPNVEKKLRETFSLLLSKFQ